MKKLILGAGVLVLSNSALAGVVHASSAVSPWTTSPVLQDAVVDAGMSQIQAANWAGSTQKTGSFDDANPVQQAATWNGDKNTQPTAAHVAEKQVWLAQNAGGSTDTAMSGDVSGKTVETAGTMSGQGGPDESVESTQGVWPACRPGRGDDRCIQLYERGVRAAFAQWSAGRSQVGMGGPEEPVGFKATSGTPATGDMSQPTKMDTGTGPTTEPTGVRVEGKTATVTG